jgi:hypothetical protein
MGRFRRAAVALAPLALFVPGVWLAGLSAPAAAQVSDYESRYGRIIEVSLDDLLSMPESYVDKAVRTHGQLEMEPTTGRLTYSLRGTFGGRLYLYPTAEAGYDWEQNARQWLGKEVEVSGAVGQGSISTGVTGQPTVYLLLWGFLGPPDEKLARTDSAQVTLEDLVMKPAQHDGKTVTVRGQFRGKNLYGDLPSASRQRSADWVLKDDSSRLG